MSILLSSIKVRLWLEIEGLWRADYIKWVLPGLGHVTCSRAIAISLSQLFERMMILFTWQYSHGIVFEVILAVEIFLPTC